MQIKKAAKNAGLAASLLGILAATAVGCGGGKEAEPTVNMPEQGQVMYVPGNSTSPYLGKDLVTGGMSNGDIKIIAYENAKPEDFLTNGATGNVTFPKNDPDSGSQSAELKKIKSQQHIVDFKKNGMTYHLYVDYGLPENDLIRIRDNIEGNYIQFLANPSETVTRNREQWILVNPGQFEVDRVYRPSGFEQYDWSVIKGSTTNEIPQKYDIWEVIMAEYDTGFNPDTKKQTSGFIRARIGYRDKNDQLQIYNGELRILVRQNGSIASNEVQEQIVRDLVGNELEILTDQPYTQHYDKNRKTNAITYLHSDNEKQLRIAIGNWSDRN